MFGTDWICERRIDRLVLRVLFELTSAQFYDTAETQTVAGAAAIKHLFFFPLHKLCFGPMTDAAVEVRAVGAGGDTHSQDVVLSPAVTFTRIRELLLLRGGEH